MKKLNWDKVILETYVELYDNAEPKVDFNRLLAEAKSNGTKIDFMAYEIDGSIMEDIVVAQIKKYKMNSWAERSFRFSVYLGSSPKTKVND